MIGDHERDSAPEKSSKKVIRPKEMPDETGLSIRSVWEQVADGTLPAPIQIGPRAVGWLAVEIDEWRQKKRRERDARLAQGLPAHNIPTSEPPLKRPRGRPRKVPAAEAVDTQEAHA